LKKETMYSDRRVYKLVIKGDSTIQGLISLQGDTINILLSTKEVGTLKSEEQLLGRLRDQEDLSPAFQTIQSGNEIGCEASMNPFPLNILGVLTGRLSANFSAGCRQDPVSFFATPARP